MSEGGFLSGEMRPQMIGEKGPVCVIPLNAKGIAILAAAVNKAWTEKKEQA